MSDVMGDYMGKRLSFEFEFPAGSYYVGDPCYVLGKKDQAVWDQVVNQICAKDFNGVAELNGTKFVSGGTAHGDGYYSDNKGRKYAVDSGTIACIPVKLIDMEHFDQRLANILNFKRPFKATCVGGNFKF